MGYVAISIAVVLLSLLVYKRPSEPWSLVPNVLRAIAKSLRNVENDQPEWRTPERQTPQEKTVEQENRTQSHDGSQTPEYQSASAAPCTSTRGSSSSETTPKASSTQPSQRVPVISLDSTPAPEISDDTPPVFPAPNSAQRASAGRTAAQATSTSAKARYALYINATTCSIRSEAFIYVSKQHDIISSRTLQRPTSQPRPHNTFIPLTRPVQQNSSEPTPKSAPQTRLFTIGLGNSVTELIRILPFRRVRPPTRQAVATAHAKRPQGQTRVVRVAGQSVQHHAVLALSSGWRGSAHEGGG